MAKLATASVAFDHTTDAGYRVWAAAVLSALDTVNPAILTRTADTGQMNTATITRPATNVTTDYAIYKFDDGLSVPLYFKLAFGTGNTNNAPGMRFTLGKGSDGAGNITGVLYNIAGVWSGNNAAGISGPILSCVVAGHFSLMACQSPLVATGTLCFGIAFSRSTDASGTPTTEGVHGMIKQWSSGSFQHFTADISGATQVNSASDTQVTVGQLYAKTSLSTFGVVKPMPVFYLTPDPRVAVGLAAVDNLDAAVSGEMSVAMVGATPRNYKFLGLNTTQKAYATVWE